MTWRRFSNDITKIGSYLNRISDDGYMIENI